MTQNLVHTDRPIHNGGTKHAFRAIRRIAVVAAFGMAFALTGCSSGGSATSGTSAMSTTSGPSGTSVGASDSITIKNFAFSPSNLTVAPGTVVTVTNKDSVAHTLTSSAGGFDTGTLQEGQSKTFTAPNKAGSYAYICTIHQYMTGTLTVS